MRARQTARQLEQTRHAMNAAAQLPELSSAGVQPADRLGFTIFLAAVLHAALILGLGFTLAEPSQISKTLEINHYLRTLHNCCSCRYYGIFPPDPSTII